MHRHLRRGASLAAAVTTAALITTLAPAPAHAGNPTPAGLSSTWLAAQLTSGVVHNDQFDFDDLGLTVDIGLALAETGTQPTALGDISTAMATRVDSYTTGVDFGSSDIYAGASGKLLVFAQTVGQDPTSYGGVDLVQRTNQRVSTKTVIKGRIEDRTSGTDFANVIGQAFAAQGLWAAQTGKADEAVAFLLDQQCAQGYFRLNFTKSKTSAKQTCDSGNPDTTSAPDTDVTALAVLALDAMTGKTRAMKNRLTKAKAWLQGKQKGNGSFGGGTSTEGSNTNSTGLASWALGEVGACGDAQDAAEWVEDRQATFTTGPLATEQGAIAYDNAAFAAGQTDGITVATRDQWRRATSQAAPALTNLVLADCRAR